MKRIVTYVFTALLSATGTLIGQELSNGLLLWDPAVDVTDSTISLSLTALSGYSHRGTTVICVPNISRDGYTVSFDPIVMQDSRARRAHRRKGRQWESGENILLRRGDSIGYVSHIPFQTWMDGAVISAEILTANCGSVSKTEEVITVLTDAGTEFQGGIFIQNDFIPETVSQEENHIADQPLTIADSLSKTLTFVLPVEEFDPENPLVFYDDERDNAITVFFPINSYDILPDHLSNRHALNNLLGAIEIISSSANSRVGRVVVAGFASPDGPFALNDRLAWERAVSVKEYIMRQTGLPDDLITIYNGSADWQGLRLMIVNDPSMPSRREALEIIDNHPIWNPRTNTGRNSLLMQLNDGDVYRYMAEHIYPRLRNGAFIRVYYDNNRN